MKLRPYLEYKDSGSLWLGKLPSSWAISKLKMFSTMQTGSTPSTLVEQNYSDEGFPWYRPEDINEQNSKIEATKFLSELGKSDVRKSRAGCTVLCGIGTIGKAALAEQEFSTNQQLIAIDSKLDDNFCFYLILAARAELESLSTGNVVRILNNERLGSLSIPLMDLNCQQKIAIFLDRETGKLDTLIAKQEHLIELLQEKRQAIISYAVTKGLNPDAKMKDSGVEWLGMVPESWEITKIKHVANLNPKVPDWVRSSPNLFCNFLPMEKIGDDGTCTLDTDKEVIDVVSGYTYFENGDVCYAKVTPCFENGKGVVFSGLKNGIGFGTTEITVFRPTELILSEFLYFIFQSMYFKSVGESSMTGAGGLKRVSDGVAENLVIAIPTVSEQVELLEQLKSMIKTVDDLTDKAKRSIELAKEHRTALISAAVTGKIDIREAA